MRTIFTKHLDLDGRIVLILDEYNGDAIVLDLSNI